MALPMCVRNRREFCRKSLKYLMYRFGSQNNMSFNKRYIMFKSCRIALDENKSLDLEVGKMAKFADGSVVAKVGDTSVLVAITSKTESNPNATFLPLTVDYRQKSAAAGRIPTNHLRRELGPTDKEILTSRVIDRSLRTLFPSDYFYETQVTCNLLSVDGIHDPDVVSINAASAALSTSNIPWNGPVGAVRVGRSESQFVVNPTRKIQDKSDINLVIATDKNKNIVMLEGEMDNIPYLDFDRAVEFGVNTAANIAKEIEKFAASFNKEKRSYVPPTVIPNKLLEDVRRVGAERINATLNYRFHDKISRDKELQKVRHFIVRALSSDNDSPSDPLVLHEAVSIVIKQLFREQILYNKKRCDGRSLFHVRPITCDVDLYKPVHGSALFQRGQTQVLSTVTFDSLQASMKVDPISVLTGAMKEKNFMLHYEFPAYATNDIKSPGIKNRRELGHGALAEKGLRAIIPDKYPFSIRLTAEVLESNGSSSMASICSGSLALMDAGVKIKQAAAGVAIGLITDDKSDQKYELLVDILGIEDYMGDMDMKIGGTKNGITAIQMDLKTPGIHLDVLFKALRLAKTSIEYIIFVMAKEGIRKPRETIKPCGPVTERITVTPAKRGSFLGVGGVNLKKLQSQTGVTVTTVDESTFEIFAPNKDALTEAQEMISTWLSTQREPVLEFGAVYEGKITEIRNNGLMVQLHPAMEPVLLSNSQIDIRKVSHPDVLGFEVGQMIRVKYFGRDPNSGQIRISRKVLISLPGRVNKFIKEEEK